jgi:hypothetical protein
LFLTDFCPENLIAFEHVDLLALYKSHLWISIYRQSHCIAFIFLLWRLLLFLLLSQRFIAFRAFL